MAQRPAQSIQIGGTKYKVNATAPEEDVQRLAEAVDLRLREMNPRGAPVTPQMFLLVALSFAHDVEAATKTRRTLEAETRDLLRRMVSRIDLALEEDEAEGDQDEGQPSPHS